MLRRSDLHEYQRRMSRYVIDNKKCALFCEMGLGKTVSSLTAVHDLKYLMDLKKVLVIAPVRVTRSVWPCEIKKWDFLRDLTYRVIDGTPFKRVSKLEGKEDIHLISRELTPWLVEHFARLQKWPYDMIIIDESSSFKNHASKRFKALRRVRGVTERILELTGTPATKGLLGLWPQVLLLDNGARLEAGITRYREKYFNQDYSGFKWGLKEGAEKIIHEKISDICLSLSANDYLKMPERIDNMIEVEVPVSAMDKYLEMEKEFVTTVSDEVVDATSAGVKAGKLLQMANGAIYLEGGQEWRVLHDAKLNALESVVEEANETPVIIVYNFKHDLERLKARFPNGKVLDKTGKVEREWNSGMVPILFMHPASGGHGLNLQGGSNVLCWFGLNWSLELYQQMNARIYRQGQSKKTVVIHHIVAKGTVDEVLLEGLKKHDVTQKSLFKALRDRILSKTSGQMS